MSESDARRSWLLQIAASAILAFLTCGVVYLVAVARVFDWSHSSAVHDPVEELKIPLIAAGACALVSHVLIRRWLSACAVSAGAYAAGCMVHTLALDPHETGVLIWGVVAGFFGLAVASALAVPLVILRGPRERPKPPVRPLSL